MIFIVIFPFRAQSVGEHTPGAKVYYLFVKQKNYRRKMSIYAIKYNYCNT